MVIWTDSALEDLQNIMIFSKAGNVKLYLKKLVIYTEVLYTMPFIGTKLKKFSKYHQNFFQLIYKNHKIIYFIKNNKVYILFVVHFRQDLALRFIRHFKF